MPIDYKNYPKNWKTEIRPAILQRARNCCEFCGAKNYAPNPKTGSRVVLTVAHLDHDTSHNTDENLKALCQLCHNRYDALHRAKNRRDKKMRGQMKEKLELLQKMMHTDFDYEESNENIEDLFLELFRLHSYKEQGERPVGTLSCGSCSFRDTPKTLYRLLYLLHPQNADFSRMYKTGTLFEICSPDYNFCASIEFYKYELCAYFHCAPEFNNKKRSQLICGAPGSDNHDKCISDIGNLWFKTFKDVLEYEHDVYPGNNFRV